MNMQELAARYARMAQSVKQREQTTDNVYLAHVLRGCALFIGDNETREQAINELQLAWQIAHNLYLYEQHMGMENARWHKRQMCVLQRAIGQVRRCEVAA